MPSLKINKNANAVAVQINNGIVRQIINEPVNLSKVNNKMLAILSHVFDIDHDEILINDVAPTGTVDQVIAAIAEKFASGQGAGFDASTLQSFATNAEAVAAIGVGKLYKSSSLSIEDSPAISITV